MARLKAGQEHQGVSDQEWLSFDPVRPSIRSSAAKIPQLTLSDLVLGVVQLRSLNWPWSSQEWVAGSGYLLSTYNLLLQINLSAPQKYFFSIIHILHTILYFSLDFSEFQPCFISENLYFEFICIYDQLPNNNVPSKWSNKYIVIRLEMPSALIIWNFWINKILPFQLSSCRLPLNGCEDKSSDLKPSHRHLIYSTG